MNRKELLRKVRAAEENAKEHPSAALRDKFAIWPERLTAEEKELVESHMIGCERCRLEISDSQKHRDFFHRQKEPCD